MLSLPMLVLLQSIHYAKGHGAFFALFTKVGPTVVHNILYAGGQSADFAKVGPRLLVHSIPYDRGQYALSAKVGPTSQYLTPVSAMMKVNASRLILVHNIR